MLGFVQVSFSIDVAGVHLKCNQKLFRMVAKLQQTDANRWQRWRQNMKFHKKKNEKMFEAPTTFPISRNNNNNNTWESEKAQNGTR